MIVLVTTYNCSKYIEKSLYSIMSQRGVDFKCYITDDLSTDNTVEIVENTIKDDDRFILIKNTKKHYQPGNYDQVIRGLDIPDEEICVEVDGDDWLPNSNVLKYIYDVYESEDVWMTSGSFKYHDGRQGFANPPKNFTNIRNQTFTLSHLRTWKSWLWKKIQVEDLKDDKNEYWSVAGDLSFMFPMLEMSGKKHFKYIPEILYIYNESNPLNDHKVNMSLVTNTVSKIRNKKPYKLLDNTTKDPYELLTPYRFDVVLKYMYAKSIIKNYKTEVFKNYYKEHIKLWNGFKEYDNPNKNNFESFDTTFKNIITSFQSEGFNSEISQIPTLDEKYIVNGAHRLAAAMATKREVVIREADMPKDGQKNCSWENTFLEIGLPEKICDRTALEYAKLKKNTYVLTLFPTAKGEYKKVIDIIKKHGKLVYYKKLELTKYAPLNLMREFYVGESWAGGPSNDWSGFRHKENLCFTNDYPCYVFLIELDNYQISRTIKDEVREIFNVGNHSCHINDTHEQTVRLSQILFNENSIKHLTNTKPTQFSKFQKRLDVFKKLIEKNNLDIDEYAVTASSVLSIYGLRESNDIDYIHYGNNIIEDSENMIQSHNSYGVSLYPLPYDEILFNPEYHFYSQGVKFVTPEIVKVLKEKRNEIKDITDINLINSIL